MCSCELRKSRMRDLSPRGSTRRPSGWMPTISKHSSHVFKSMPCKQGCDQVEDSRSPMTTWTTVTMGPTTRMILHVRWRMTTTHVAHRGEKLRSLALLTRIVTAMETTRACTCRTTVGLHLPACKPMPADGPAPHLPTHQAAHSLGVPLILGLACYAVGRVMRRATQNLSRSRYCPAMRVVPTMRRRRSCGVE